MKKLTLGLSAAAIALSGAAALAQVGPMAGMKMDPMGDKTVTRAEAQAMATQMFEKMDATHDGKLDQADREAHRAERRAKMFDQFDTDKNGAISREEFMAAHKDGGKDGGKGGWGRAGGKDHDGPGMGHGGRGGRMGHGGGMMMMAKMADANKDGAIGKDEFLAAHARHFDMADANHDSKLTPDERKAAHQKMRDMMGKMHGKRDGGPMGGMDMPPPPPPPGQ